eukprot:12467034-Prorocentrum_lima.AAC.1
MTGEVRVRALEEEVELKILPTLTNRATPNVASASSTPTAAGMEGITKKTCTKFYTDQGCPFGRKCQYEHPRE